MVRVQSYQAPLRCSWEESLAPQGEGLSAPSHFHPLDIKHSNLAHVPLSTSVITSRLDRRHGPPGPVWSTIYSASPTLPSQPVTVRCLHHANFQWLLWLFKYRQTLSFTCLDVL